MAWTNEQKRENWWANRDRYLPVQRDRTYRHRYGIGSEDVQRIYHEQNGQCAICGKGLTLFSRGMHVDHNHKTGVVRGILCMRCNHLLACLEDELWLHQARSYLEEHA